MINYTYKVINVNTDSNTMEFEFSSDGKQTYTVGAALPQEGVSLDNHAARYAPIHMWESETLNYMLPEIGASGTNTHKTMEELEAERVAIAQEPAQISLDPHQEVLIRALIHQILAEMAGQTV